MSEEFPDIRSLKTSELLELLKNKDFSDEACQIIEENEIDGFGFLELNDENLASMFPGKIGIIKKVKRIQSDASAKLKKLPAAVNTTDDTKPDESDIESPAVSVDSTPKKDESMASHAAESQTPDTLNIEIGHVQKKVDQLTTFQSLHKPHSYILPSPRKAENLSFPNPDKVDVTTLNCNEFAAWLKAKKFSPEVCQIFKGNEIGGDTFMELKETDLSGLLPGKVGIVKKLLKVQLNATDEQAESLAVKMKWKSMPINDPLCEIATYKLPIKEIMRNEQKRNAKYILGSPPRQKATTEKVLMVVGATGAGKTTLINGMVNYIFGVDWKNDFRLVLVKEQTGRSQAHSQTDFITAYTIYPSDDSQLPYPLTIIDTPGFGDTRGVERDRKLVEQIRDFFSVQGSNGIDHLDGIGFVTQASLSRLTPTHKYVFHSILSVFGNDVADNFFTMVTFADGKYPPVMVAMEQAEINCAKFFKFNNSALFASNKNGGDEENFDRMFWKMDFTCFKKFFVEFSRSESVSLCLTKEVLKERNQLEVTVQALQQQISAGMAELDKLRQEKIVLQLREAEVATNKNFTYQVDVTKQRKKKLPTGVYCTNCLTCNFTCHNDCAYSNDGEKYRCSAMDGGGKSNAYCTACPQKCFWQQHVNNPYIFEFYTERETKTSADLLARYDTAVEEKNKVEAILLQMENHLVIENDVISKVEQVQKTLLRLDEIALKKNPLTEVQYIELLIEAEKQEAKVGFQGRIQFYEQAKKQAQLMEKAKNNPKDIRILQENRRQRVLAAKQKAGKAASSWFTTVKFWK